MWVFSIPWNPFVFRTLDGPVRPKNSATFLLIRLSLAPRSLITLINNDTQGSDGWAISMTEKEIVFCLSEIALYNTAGLS